MSTPNVYYVMFDKSAQRCGKLAISINALLDMMTKDDLDSRSICSKGYNVKHDANVR